MQMGYGHDHSHGQSSKNLRTAFWINSVFAVIELLGGLYTNSVAILSDALHDFGDSLSLGISWYLQKKSGQPGDATYTYGYKRFSVLGAFVMAIVLTTGLVFVIIEAVERLIEPQQANAEGMLLLAVAGITFNGVAMLRLKKGKSINEQIVSLHFLEDVLGWVAVLIGAVVMMFFNVPVLDPILSIGIACFILFNVYRNLKPALRIILQGVPHPEQEKTIITLVKEMELVKDIHDFRMWSLDGEHSVLSMHVAVTHSISLKEAEHLKERIKKRLESSGVTHATIEIEFEPGHG